jgi:transcriptional regulator with XRE-family HTH domain
VVTGAQLRAARGLLNVSVAEVAADTGLAVNTVRRAEAVNGPCPITAANSQTLRSWFEAEGVIFLDADETGPGVRLMSVEPLPTVRRRRAKI